MRHVATLAMATVLGAVALLGCSIDDRDLEVTASSGNGGAAGGPALSSAAGKGAEESPSHSPAPGSCCVTAPPEPWIGPFHFYEGPAVDVPDCSGDAPVEAFTGGTEPVQEALTCSACSCGSPGANGANQPSCLLPGRGFDGGVGGACTSAKTYFKLRAGMCVAGATGYYFEGFEASGGSCTPQGGDVAHRGTPRWTAMVRGCLRESAKKGACGSGETCLAPPSNPFADKLCAYRPGQHDCPSGYPQQSIYFTEFDDQRECSKCSCGAPQALTCTADVTAYSEADCSGNQTTEFVGDFQSCQHVSNTVFPDLSIDLQNIEFGGSCQPSESETAGGIAAVNPITVCCR